VIGAPVRRVEDLRFLTGSGRFVDDLVFPGMLYCVLVRSPHAHARIPGIEFPPGLVVLTGRDMEKDGVGPMRAGWVLPDMVEPQRWALARDTVRHVGEPVAAVFA
jgi:carbon-monoxide dehydrogenase large subunit